MEIENDKILCVGEMLWDRLPGGAKSGGAVMNVALHLRTIGLDVTFASSVGADKAGDELKLFLKKARVSTEYIQTDEILATSEVLVHLDEQNNATYEIKEPVAWDNIRLTPALVDKAERAGLLIYGSLASRNPQTRDTLMRLLNTKTVKFMDVNFREPYVNQEIIEKLLQKADIVKLNDEELLVLANWHNKQGLSEHALIKWFVAYYKLQMVCVTKGENGALLYNDNTFYEHPGYRVRVVDTVGAGDAFLAGLVAALLHKKKPVEALAYACATGAFVASNSGATPKFKETEIERIMQAQSE
ncbi:MAG TPA: carbohydrate kinase [Draconibacterium sp.]|nr:carbohydrate kinase [Draconibacterium sp.]